MQILSIRSTFVSRTVAWLSLRPRCGMWVTLLLLLMVSPGFWAVDVDALPPDAQWQLMRQKAATKPKEADQKTTAPSPSRKKGVCWRSDNDYLGLKNIGVVWSYDWWSNPFGKSMPPGMEFIPMIYSGGALKIQPELIDEAKRYGNTLLGFNEPDHTDQSNMTPEKAIELWPRLMATGMRLGSPAPAGFADKEDKWLGKFMKLAAEKKYRVDFICVHSYLWDYDAKIATKMLKDYLEGTYKIYKKPIWLTEFALANFKKPASAEQQVAFVKEALPMLEKLPFVERYAWFKLGTLDKGSHYEFAGLCKPDGSLTPVGIAYRDTQ